MSTAALVPGASPESHSTRLPHVNDARLAFVPPPALIRGCWALAVLGLATFGIGLALEPTHAWASWLMNAFLFLGAALFALFFMAVNTVAAAGWHIAIRRPLEAMTGWLPLALLSFLVLLPGMASVYSWMHHGEGAHAHLIEHKQAVLSQPFFIASVVCLFALWIVFARTMVLRSRRQDTAAAGSAAAAAPMRLSALCLVVFAPTFSLASFLWIMSLEPTWFSTIFAVYQFAGMFQSGVAMTIILLVLLRHLGWLREAVGENHYHTLGQWLFAFSAFWGYLWFSQVLLIWYTNIPEETQHYLLRSQGAWWHITFVLNPVLNFVLPFLLLLPRPAKRNHSMLLRICLIVMAGRWVDLWLAVMPVFQPDGPSIGLLDIGVTVGFAGAFCLTVLTALRRAPLIARNDPCLQESLHLDT